MRARTVMFLVVGMLVAVGPLAAQQRRKQQQQPREKMPKNGVIQNIAPGFLAVQTEDGGKWVVSVKAAKEVSVVGSADASWLQPQMLIRFQARFTKRGQAVEPISEMEVLTLKEGVRFGMYPEVRAIGGAAGNLFGDEKAVQARPKVRPKAVRPEEITYTVVGKIAKIRKGELTIAAGRLLRAELANPVRIAIDLPNLALVRRGDKVELDAWYPPNSQGKAMANSVHVSLSKPLVGETKKVRGVGKAPATSGKADPFGVGDPLQEGDKKEGAGKKGVGKKEAGKKGAKKDPFDDDL